MITQELLDYITKQTQAGFDATSIRQSLVNNGWDPTDVDTAFKSMKQTSHDSAAPTGMSQGDATAAIKKMGKFKASFKLFRQSLNLLQQDKEVVLFPVISSVILMLLTGIYLGAVFLLGGIGMQDGEATITNAPLFYGTLFIYYVASYFILTYFKVGLTAVVYERINGGDIDFKEGMSRAANISGKIFVWSLLAATVGMVLKMISDRSKFLGKLAASLLGAAWNIVTMFIAPTLLLDNVSVWQSVKNSGSVFKKTWGETLIINISFGLINLVLVLGSIMLFGGLGMLAVGMGLGLVGIIIVGTLFILTMIVISIITSSLSEIFKVALYSYARFGIIAEGFSPEFIVGAVKEGKQ